MADLIIAGTLIVLGAASLLLLGLAKASARRRPAATRPAPTRHVYRCAAGHGPTKCTAPATRIVLRISGPTESAVMCDEDTFRAARLGHVIDLGPIVRPGR